MKTLSINCGTAREWRPLAIAFGGLLLLSFAIDAPPGLFSILGALAFFVLAPVKFPPRRLSRQERITEAVRAQRDKFEVIPWLLEAVRFGDETERAQARNKLVNLLYRAQKSHDAILKTGVQIGLIKHVFGRDRLDSDLAHALFSALRRLGSPSALPRLRRVRMETTQRGAVDGIMTDLDQTIQILELRGRKMDFRATLLRASKSCGDRNLVRPSKAAEEDNEVLLQPR